MMRSPPEKSFAKRTRGWVLAALLAAGACETYAAQDLSAPSEAEPVEAGVLSSGDFSTTDDRLKTAIETRGLTIFTVVDHAAGAERAGLTLAPSKLYIFGNPKAGTPLMQANPALGLDLPLKALVYQSGDDVRILTSDIGAITSDAGVSEPGPLISNVSQTLSAIAAEAADLSTD